MEISLLSKRQLGYNTDLMPLQLIGSVLKKNNIKYQYDYYFCDGTDKEFELSTHGLDKEASLDLFLEKNKSSFLIMKEKVKNKLKPFNYEWNKITHLIISSSEHRFLLRDLLLIDEIKQQYPDMKVILGGPNTYYFNITCDADVIVNFNDPNKIVGILDKKGFFEDSQQPDIQELNQEITLPVSEEAKQNFGLLTTIGCRNKCDFCTSSKLGTKFQYFNVEYLLSKAKQIKEYGYKLIFFCGDSSTAIGGKNVKKLFEGLKEVGIRSEGLACFSDYHYLGEEIYRLMSEARFIPIIGLESGSERLRSKMNKPRYTNKEILEMVDYHVEYNIPLTLAFFSGHLYETQEDFEQTIDLINQICEKWSNSSVLLRLAASDFCLSEDTVLGRKYPNLERGINFVFGKSTPEIRRKRFAILDGLIKIYCKKYDNIQSNCEPHYIPHALLKL